MVKVILMIGSIYMLVFWVWAIRAVIRLYTSKVRGSRLQSILLGFVILVLSGTIGLTVWVILS